jgi:phenylpropionate dioxygenase-like ring-hydroxylating dioxygenase large terminal subunit
MIIDPAIYTDRGIFEEEIRRFFHSRYFVGAVTDFPEVDCYRSFVLGGKAVTVRRTPEGIRAFNNVCLHRSSILDPPGSGQRAFRCNYHGWRYGPDGALTHSPFVPIEQIRNCRLATYPVSIVDGLVFVGLSGNVPELSKVAGVLERCGLAGEPAKPFHSGSDLIRCNWKQLFESVAENYHLNFVHADSFSRANYASTGTFDWDRDGYTFWHEMTPSQAGDRQEQLKKKLVIGFEHVFRHVYIFPNLFAVNAENIVGFHNKLTPLSPGETLVEWSLFELPPLQRAASGVREHLRDSVLKFSLTAQAEDKRVIESCGSGITRENASVQLQPTEPQLQQFHRFYSEAMKDVL